ncbi:MAG: phosphoribosylformylglycinamidine synthase, partial [Ruminococcaceae bacterium]|nr:phosphoribosylformylglycinamidine synthase [Oscillospiraceae bacterium]
VGAARTDTATAMSFGINTAHMRISPFHGAAYSVVESLSKLAAVGADALSARLTFQEYFEKLGSDPVRWGKPAAALLGAMTAQIKLGVPSIGGKDSMSGSFNDIDVPPTLVSFALAMTSAQRTVSAAFKQSGSRVVMLPIPQNNETLLPDWDKLSAMYKAVYELSCNGMISAASSVREGGAAAALCRMCFGNGLGFAAAGELSRQLLFAPQTGALVLELASDAVIPAGVECIELGTTNDSGLFSVNGAELSVDELKNTWLAPLEDIFPNDPKAEVVMGETPLYTERAAYPSILTNGIAKPRVFIPAFPGTNCENDSAKAFELAGADVRVMVLRNLTPAAIEQSIDTMAELISESQIIMLPGGFSGGDEPDGSGKFIATTLRNPRIAEAVTDLLDNRDGLMLGICNGFQALIKLGLVPTGRICDLTEDAPTLTFNTLGRHVSRTVYTRISSVKSPWLSLCEAGDVFTIPVSHGEGRFVANAETLEQLSRNGQIATSYCDLDGNPSDDILWNPNGSAFAIEGITSPDGRVFGKMGHSERMGSNIIKNISGNKDQRLFESGVRYFK